jgi:hypothetical protein
MINIATEPTTENSSDSGCVIGDNTTVICTPFSSRATPISWLQMEGDASLVTVTQTLLNVTYLHEGKLL